MQKKKEGKTKTPGVCLSSKDNIKTNPIESGPSKVMTIVLEACSKFFHALLKAPEQRNKIFQNFVETRHLKNLKVFIHQSNGKIETQK